MSQILYLQYHEKDETEAYLTITPFFLFFPTIVPKLFPNPQLHGCMTGQQLDEPTAFYLYLLCLHALEDFWNHILLWVVVVYFPQILKHEYGMFTRSGLVSTVVMHGLISWFLLCNSPSMLSLGVEGVLSLFSFSLLSY